MPTSSSSPAHSAITARYDVKETIGTGGFAKVKAGKHKLTGMPVAIKIMDKSGLGDDLPRAYREIETLKSLRHHHVCQLYEVVETADKIYMVMEYAPGGELFDYIVAKDRLKESEARKFFRQIVSAVAYVHSKGYAHRDLKPENLLLDDKQNIKLIDFGLVANPTSLDDPLQTCCGSPAYAAPELIIGQPYLGTEADVWSMGVLLYALLCGYLPFDHDNTAYLYRLIQRGKYDTPKWMSEDSKKFIAQLLVTNPTRRLTVEQLVEDEWMVHGTGPVDWESKYNEVPDVAVLEEMAKGYGRSLADIREEVAQWRFDALTATYYLLLKMKLKGKTMAMKKVVPAVLAPRRSQTPDRPRSPALSRLRSDSMDMYSSVESLPGGSDTEEPPLSSGLPPLTPPVHRKGNSFGLQITLPPPSPSASAMTMPLSPPTPTVNVLTKFLVKTGDAGAKRTNRSSSFGNAFELAQTAPVKSASFMSGSADDDVFQGRAKLAPPTAALMRERAQSIDTSLDGIGRGQSKEGGAAGASSSAASNGKASTLARDTAPSYATPTTSRRNASGTTGGRLSGSFSNLFGRLTQRKEPRKVKGLYNFETTSNKPAAQVLSEVVRVVQEKKIVYKMKGYVVRCKILDAQRKVTLEFDFEICQLPQMDLIGIHRKRLKGDTFAFKKACEDILHAMHI